jgi:hypothetical protein
MSNSRKRENEKDRLPGKKEEQDLLLTRLESLAPFLEVLLHLLEIILKLFGVIK